MPYLIGKFNSNTHRLTSLLKASPSEGSDDADIYGANTKGFIATYSLDEDDGDVLVQELVHHTRPDEIWGRVDKTGKIYKIVYVDTMGGSVAWDTLRHLMPDEQEFVDKKLAWWGNKKAGPSAGTKGRPTYDPGTDSGYNFELIFETAPKNLVVKDTRPKKVWQRHPAPAFTPTGGEA